MIGIIRVSVQTVYDDDDDDRGNNAGIIITIIKNYTKKKKTMPFCTVFQSQTYIVVSDCYDYFGTRAPSGLRKR